MKKKIIFLVAAALMLNSCDDLFEQTFFVALIEYFKTLCKETECSDTVNTFCFSLL